MTGQSLSLSAVQSLLGRYDYIHKRVRREQMRGAKTLFSGLRSLYRAEQYVHSQLASRFNIFNALDVTEKELVHSKFLAYLLDPRGRHDQGSRFLKSFLDCCNVSPIPPLISLDLARVATEYFLGLNGRLDIVIFLQDQRVVAIENKVWAGEGDHQLQRYQNWLVAQGTARRHCLVYLTPTGREPDQGLLPIQNIQFKQLSYKDLASTFSVLCDGLPPRLAHVIDQYVEVCSEIEGNAYEG